MSRSWERKVRKNMSNMNKQRKKQGTGQIVLNAEKMDRFVGRNFMAPILLMLFVAMYSVLMSADPAFEVNAMYIVTLAAYIGLAALFFFRRPYLQIGKDYVQSRRFTGDKRLAVSNIMLIRVQNGYVTIVPQKGGAWTFTRLLNRFPTDQMAEKLKTFAQTHNITFEEK